MPGSTPTCASRLAPTVPERHLPHHRQPQVLCPLLYPHVPRITPHPRLLTVQQPVRLRHVVHVGWRRCKAVHHPRGRVRSDVQFHPKVILVPLLHLTHRGRMMVGPRSFPPVTAPPVPLPLISANARGVCMACTERLRQTRAAPTPPRTTDPPSQDRSGCSRAAPGEPAALPTEHRADARDPPWDSAAQCAPPIAATAPGRSKNLSRRVLAFCAYTPSRQRWADPPVLP